MKKLLCLMTVILLSINTVGCSHSNIKTNRPVLKNVVSDNSSEMGTGTSIDSNTNGSSKGIASNDFRLSIVEKYSKMTPHEWGEDVTGVITRINTDKKIIALTFDACGGKGGKGYDNKLIDYLEEQNVPATLFINSRWIDENYDTFKKLADNPLFEIENHGTEHKPLSINGKTAYGITGTSGPNEVIDEVSSNAEKIRRITGRTPRYFRTGTAYYDEVSVRIVQELGEKAVNFSVLGDAGATYKRDQIRKACLKAGPGSIIIFHMNHPEKDTAEGIMEAIPLMRERGFKFVKLETYDDSLE